MKQYLIDASALMILLKKADTKVTISILHDSCILDLTFYEIGNAIWKETTLTKFITPETAKTLQKMAQTILLKTDRINIGADSFEKIMEIAKTEKLTFYDSSYVHFAKEKDLQLVTEDKELKIKAQKHVKAQSITALLSNN